MTNEQNEVLATWETSSQYWNKHQQVIERMFAPLSRALIEAAGIGPGNVVLDIGGGSGEPSMTIAQVVGPNGSVTYTDPAAGMVSSAREAATRRGLHNIRFEQCPAEKLPFADGTFDAAVGRLSTMFFTDVLAGLREALRVLKNDGHVALLVWSKREANPFFSIVSEVLDRHVPPEPEDEDAPGAFRFAPTDKLASLLREAGASGVSERSVPFTIEAPITVDEFWELRTEMSDTFRKKLASLAPEQVAEIKHEVQAGVADFFKAGDMKFPGEVLIVSGKKRS